VEEYLRSRVPWSTEPSLKQKTDDVGIDFDDFIAGLKNKLSDVEMAAEFGVSEKTISYLREHFMSHGLGSIMGQD
jgi:DNA-directed RNA polymerase specialized sigma subunit